MSSRFHDPSKRATAIADYYASGDTAVVVAARHDIPRATFAGWVNDSEDDGIELTGGAWVAQGGIQRWVPGAEPVAEPVAEVIAYDSLIACPTCHARAHETCRTESGHTTTPHGSRLIGRLCICGEPLAPRRRYCDPCRDETDRRNKRESSRRTRGAGMAA